MTLNEVRIGESAYIKQINGTGAVKRRIMDMGLTKGVMVTVRKVAPLGDPIELNCRGYELSIRKEDAANIEVIDAYSMQCGDCKACPYCTKL